MQKGVDYIGVGVGAVIMNSEHKFFTTKRGGKAKNERGLWEFPGGAVEFGDTLEESIIREMKEEYDIDIQVLELLTATNHIIAAENQHWVSPAFLCKIVAGVPKIMEPHKCSEIGWFSLQELEKMQLTITTKNCIAALKKKYPDGLPDFY